LVIYGVYPRSFFLNNTADKSTSFCVGDAAGRQYSKGKGDFSSTDRKWAQNIGITFYTPEVDIFEPISRADETKMSPGILLETLSTPKFYPTRLPSFHITAMSVPFIWLIYSS
jgi:hypothetical protein